MYAGFFRVNFCGKRIFSVVCGDPRVGGWSKNINHGMDTVSGANLTIV